MSKKQLEKKVEYLEKRLMINEQFMELAIERLADAAYHGHQLDADDINKLWKAYADSTTKLCDNYDTHGIVYIAKGPSK